MTAYCSRVLLSIVRGKQGDHCVEDRVLTRSSMLFQLRLRVSQGRSEKMLRRSTFSMQTGQVSFLPTIVHPADTVRFLSRRSLQPLTVLGSESARGLICVTKLCRKRGAVLVC